MSTAETVDDAAFGAAGPAATLHHRVPIVGGGTAGISVAARLRRAGERDVAVIEPPNDHYYQPLWTLVGGGRASLDESLRPEADVMPQGVRWLQDWATEFDPASQIVTTRAATTARTSLRRRGA